MSKLYEKIKSVEEFHDIFKIGNSSEMKLIDERDYTLRYNLIKEENEEYLDACKNGDLVEIADALGDQLYILFGTILNFIVLTIYILKIVYGFILIFYTG